MNGGSGACPLLSVVVATYNRLPELRAMLDSLLPQTAGQPVEVLIVDDRSTDATWEWLQEAFRDTAGVRAIRAEKNGGPGPARNAALAVARGRYFVPIDSDFLMIDGAIERILQAIGNSERALFFFPCLQYPAMRRLDELSGDREISYRSFVAGTSGELMPVASLGYLREHGFAYPELRAGGESILWTRILAGGPAQFIDFPVILYRTDVGQRICTLEYQMEHPSDLAAVADAIIALFNADSEALSARDRAQKMLAAGTYHVLAGEMGPGRKRLASAAASGCWQAVPTLIASLGGRRLFRSLFRYYRTRMRRAYL